MFFNFVVPRREEALSLRIKQGPERPVEAFSFLLIFIPKVACGNSAKVLRVCEAR